MTSNEPTYLQYAQIPMGFEPVASFAKRDASILEMYLELQEAGVPVVLAEGGNGRRSVWIRGDSMIMKKFTEPN